MSEGAGAAELGGQRSSERSSPGLPGGMDLVLGAAIALAAGLSAIYHQERTVLRAVLSAPALLLVPGYFLLQAILSSVPESPTPGAQAALAVGFSLPIVGLAALATALGPWGFRPTPIVVGVTLASLLTIGVAGYQRVSWSSAT